MSDINVTIPAQEFKPEKYYKEDGYSRCYLEEALDLAGFKDAVVESFGRTTINGVRYKPLEFFAHHEVKSALNSGEDIHVTLTPMETPKDY